MEDMKWKKDFPIFSKHPQLVYLDSAATALKPQAVIDAVDEYYRNYSANVHRGLYELSERATQAYEAARATVARFIHAHNEKEIVFTHGTTESINLVARAWGGEYLKQDDEIILSILEHHSNIVPWQLIAAKKRCHIRYLDCDEKGVIKLEQLGKLITRKTKLIAISHVSNALGTVTPLRPIIQKAHAAGVLVLVDAAQSAPHLGIDVQHLDCDFLAFSGHKIGGPTGIGVLFAREKLLNQIPPFLGGGSMIREVHKMKSTWNDVPWKFEAGTPPIAEAIGLAAALSYITQQGLATIHTHEQRLLQMALIELPKIPGVTIFGPGDTQEQSSIISFGLQGVHPHDIAAILDQKNICIRAGHHCCMPLMERLKIAATARASFYLYNTEEDVEKLIKGIWKIKRIFN